jgi:hypothetical protein
MPIIDFNNFDLSYLPISEDDELEFKSSLTPVEELKKKLACAVSGFANSGGGCFIAGVDNNGNADGGFQKIIGKQDLRDWADQIIHNVEPTPKYQIKLIDNPNGRGTIKTDYAVLVILVEESFFGPHMAPDKSYYIRAGAHTVKARHFIVEAIWAKRHFSKPRIAHIFRLKPGDQEVVQFGIIALTNVPVLNIKVEMNPPPKLLEKDEESLSLSIPVIDSQNPFFMDFSTTSIAWNKEENNISLKILYSDLEGNIYTYVAILEVSKSIPQLHFIYESRHEKKVSDALESIAKSLEKNTK